MRVLVYLCAGVFSYQYHKSVCVERVGLPVCWCPFIQYYRSVCDESAGLPVCWCVLISIS